VFIRGGNDGAKGISVVRTRCDDFIDGIVVLWGTFGEEGGWGEELIENT